MAMTKKGPLTKEVFEEIHRMHMKYPQMTQPEIGKFVGYSDSTVSRVLKTSSGCWEDYLEQKKQYAAHVRERYWQKNVAEETKQENENTEQTSLLDHDLIVDEMWLHDDESEQFEISYIPDSDPMKLLKDALIGQPYVDNKGVRRPAEPIVAKVGWVNASVTTLKKEIDKHLSILDETISKYHAEQLELQKQTNEILNALLQIWLR